MNLTIKSVLKVRAQLFSPVSQSTEKLEASLYDGIIQHLEEKVSKTFVYPYRVGDAAGMKLRSKQGTLQTCHYSLVRSLETGNMREVGKWVTVPLNQQEAMIQGFCRLKAEARVLGAPTQSEAHRAKTIGLNILNTRMSKIFAHRANSYLIEIDPYLGIDLLRELATGPGGAYLFMRIAFLAGVASAPREEGETVSENYLRACLSRASQVSLKGHLPIKDARALGVRFHTHGHNVGLLNQSTVKACPNLHSLIEAGQREYAKRVHARRALECPTPTTPPRVWLTEGMKITLLRPGLEYLVEGDEMHHCVGLYSGRTLILKIEGRERLTAEVSFGGEVLQLRGVCNGVADSASERAFNEWLVQNKESLLSTEA